eukprot:TRINITY_DN9692_c0_g1::TRINITY_DN9692_c0_g1_i1::g.10152::m.10152 TRINITY_DN9692_c0_g1::TRINITY_DN9692_c0_g1_i1::g.10152  ORF type:complete len:198 (-),score=10.70,sp/Q9Y3B2/EXOS1_HUMAN/47.92/7e-59,EXOSC1/PF10447.4/5.4e-25,ECR1_N/PF14382.1/2e-12,TRAM/PF01938.15/0.052,TRAM/PF01938.15/4.2e+03 TRINITY_DN9692_c0_g1_i1:24-617(-)
MVTENQYVIPGQKICSASESNPGPGTYAQDGSIFASLCGVVEFFREVGVTKEGSSQVLPTIRVIHDRKKVTLVPDSGSIVIAKITRVSTKYASAEILCVDNIPLQQPYSAQIRQQDVRTTEIDKVEIYKCFHPGDLVRAQVISLGDSKNYYLSTARNDLGVVFARSAAGETMIPISWQEMQCPKTQQKEFRKVAKIS